MHLARKRIGQRAVQILRRGVAAAAFPGGPVSLSRWIMRPHPEFDGRTPREETIAHGSESVIKVARTLTAAGW